jgi:hypothetical protein
LFAAAAVAALALGAAPLRAYDLGHGMTMDMPMSMPMSGTSVYNPESKRRA